MSRIAAASTGASVAWGVAAEQTRGGDFSVSVYRTYFYFDLTDIGTDDISAITFNYFGLSNANGEGIVVRANQDNDFGTIATSDFPLVFNSSTSMTAYSTSFTPTISGLALNAITLNATAISNANSGGASKELCLGIINYTYDYDYPDVETNFGNLLTGVNFTTTGASRANLFVTHASSGFGKDVNGVTAANIQKVNDVSSANIVKLNDVSA